MFSPRFEWHTQNNIFALILMCVCVNFLLAAREQHYCKGRQTNTTRHEQKFPPILMKRFLGCNLFNRLWSNLMKGTVSRTLNYVDLICQSSFSLETSRACEDSPRGRPVSTTALGAIQQNY